MSSHGPCVICGSRKRPCIADSIGALFCTICAVVLEDEAPQPKRRAVRCDGTVTMRDGRELQCMRRPIEGSNYCREHEGDS